MKRNTSFRFFLSFFPFYWFFVLVRLCSFFFVVVIDTSRDRRQVNFFFFGFCLKIFSYLEASNLSTASQSKSFLFSEFSSSRPLVFFSFLRVSRRVQVITLTFDWLIQLTMTKTNIESYYTMTKNIELGQSDFEEYTIASKTRRRNARKVLSETVQLYIQRCTEKRKPKGTWVFDVFPCPTTNHFMYVLLILLLLFLTNFYLSRPPVNDKNRIQSVKIW